MTSFTNVSVDNSWIEHLQNNASPLIKCLVPSYSPNLNITNTTLVSNTNPVIDVTLDSLFLNNVRFDGFNRLSYPIVKADKTRYVELKGCFNGVREHSDIAIEGAFTVNRLDEAPQTINKPYENLFNDSSLKKLTTLVADSGATISLDNGKGIFDNSSILINYASGASSVRSAQAFTVTANDHIRVSFWAWTDEDKTVDITARLNGTEDLQRTINVDSRPKKYEFTQKMTVNGYFSIFLNKNSANMFKVWVDDFQVSKDTQPIPPLPYVMNNNTTGSVAIKQGVNISEHYLFGR